MDRFTISDKTRNLAAITARAVNAVPGLMGKMKEALFNMGLDVEKVGFPNGWRWMLYTCYEGVSRAKGHFSSRYPGVPPAELTAAFNSTLTQSPGPNYHAASDLNRAVLIWLRERARKELK